MEKLKANKVQHFVHTGVYNTYTTYIRFFFFKRKTKRTKDFHFQCLCGMRTGMVKDFIGSPCRIIFFFNKRNQFTIYMPILQHLYQIWKSEEKIHI
ncbi:hypothetical protein GDO86_011900 [Hymenochirus boettgeri]|uniref:Uncharacterized protein n=1 Tax=Hymenochirus boettgeri TaxID=247094 RepID=A0A8T2JDJ3_9PIPI|nr:hypothetical protein GDO86_011900 [Hymenochirus boettgeri]